MPAKINIGLIGAGGIVEMVHIPAFLSCPGVRIAAVCDANIKLAQRVGRKNGIERAFADYRDVLDLKEIHGVVVATPNRFHAGIAMDAMRAGKHVLLEKPIAMDYREARKLYQTAKAKGIVNMAAFNYRFMPAMQYLKSLVASGKLGRIYHLRALYLQQWPGYDWSWRCDTKLSGTGQLGDVGSHLIDFARFLVGEFKSVTGRLTNIMSRRRDQASGKMARADADDAARFLCEFVNGATGAFEVTRFAPGRGCGRDEHQRVEINGAKGTAVYELQSPESLRLCIGKRKLFSGRLETVGVPRRFFKVRCSRRRLPAADALLEPRFDQAHTFVHGIRTGRGVSPSFLDGMKAMQVIDAVASSSASKREVRIP